PRSVAVIGVSPDIEIIRGRLLHNLRQHPFVGPVYPVSRSHAEVQGLKAWPDVASLPEAPDLAIVVVPAPVVVDTVRACAERGIKAVAVISSGFGEEPGADAAARDAELRAIVAQHGLVLVGPNSEGLMAAEV